MLLHANFTFDRAGQGLFYHGEIRGENKTFWMVYDCGAKGNRSQLSEIIKHFSGNFVSQKQRLGLLAISHFDLDHVSHIPELIRKCKCDTVMLPHIAKELRAALLAKATIEAKEIVELEYIRDICWLFRDPVSYFNEMSGARQIIGIRGSDDDPGNDSLGDDGSPYKPFIQSNSENFVDEEQGQLRYVGGSRHIETEGNRYSVYGGNPAFRMELQQISWLFKPLNVQEKLPTSFYCDVAQLLSQYENDWQRLLSDKRTIGMLGSIYDLYIGRGRRNSHSLLLRHEPEQNGRLLSSGCNCTQCAECFEYRHGYRWHDTLATVLLGDLELDGKARVALEKHHSIDYQAGIILIPHHGANSDDLLWLDEKAGHHDGCTTLVVSYGKDNQYRHPRFIYDGTIARLTSPVKFVNEDQEYHYDVFVHD